MFKHKIFIYKSSKKSERLGYIISKEAKASYEPLPKLLSNLLDNNDIVIHRLSTDSEDIDSIVKRDPFFNHIQFYTDLADFSERVVLLDTEGLPSPVALSKLVVSKASLDKLQLQKVLYLIYSISLGRGYKIFNSSPVAYKYGPVFEDVYRKYDHYKAREIINVKPSIRDMIKLSKSLSHPHILPIIDEVLDIVKGKSGGYLIDITHAEDGPWKKVYVENQNAVIDDETILKYNHKVIEAIN